VISGRDFAGLENGAEERNTAHNLAGPPWQLRDYVLKAESRHFGVRGPVRTRDLLVFLWLWLSGDVQLLASKAPVAVLAPPAAVVADPKILRVKIFPHEKSSKPHRRDTIRNIVRFEAPSDCLVYEGKTDQPGKTQKQLYRSSQFTIDARKDTLPLYIECATPARVVRAVGLPSFAYRGAFYVRARPEASAELEIINLVHIDDYLKSVVPSEVYSAWPMDTLKAQAVASRSYAMHHVGVVRSTRKDQVYDFDDTILYQAYTGIELENERTSHAVDTTSGEVLLHANNIIQAYYHADSGGTTESPEQVWASTIPYCQSRKEPEFPPDDLGGMWTQHFELPQLETVLRRKNILAAKQTIERLIVTPIGRTKAGRVKLITAVTPQGDRIPFPSKLLAKVVPSLPSYLFELHTKPGHTKSVEIVGRGSGHGVGLSQQGAARLAANLNWSYDKILKFYYSDVTLCDLETGTKGVLSCAAAAANISVAH
jgi:stage II sporulation protein D